MDRFQFVLAFGPIGLYLLGIAALNCRRRPTVLSGMGDVILLAMAVVGLVMIGPMQLFFPQSAALLFGYKVWIFLLAFYSLSVTLVLLTMRPRLVVYNISADQLRQTLAEVADRLDPGATWAGDSLMLPQLQIQLHLDAFARMRNVSLVASGPNQNLLGWQKLHRALSEATGSLRVGPNVRAMHFALAGAAMLAMAVWLVAHDPHATLQAMQQMFQV